MNYRNVEAELARKGWSRSDLASAIDVPRSTVVEWLRPGSTTRIPLLDAISIGKAIAPEIPVEVLFAIDDGGGPDA